VASPTKNPIMKVTVDVKNAQATEKTHMLTYVGGVVLLRNFPFVGEVRYHITFVSLRTSALSRDSDSEMFSDLHIAMETPLSCLVVGMALS